MPLNALRKLIINLSPLFFTSFLEQCEEEMKNDGKGSSIYRYDLTTGKLISKADLWYSADKYMSSYSAFCGKDLIIVNYSNFCAKITADNKVSVFQMASMGYGIGFSSDGAKLATGSMIDLGFVRDMKTGQDTKIKGAKPNPGFPEYYSNMVFDGKGNLYGRTGAIRIFRVNNESEMTPIEPIY